MTEFWMAFVVALAMLGAVTWIIAACWVFWVAATVDPEHEEPDSE